MIKNLEYILKVAEYQNINKAAEKLYISPAALSKFIINREDELGIALFNRNNKKFTLTYAGERYVEWAKKITYLDDCMNTDLQNIINHNYDVIHFGFQLMLARMIFGTVLPRFTSEYPNIKLTIESSYASNLFNMLEDNFVDFIITAHKEKISKFEYTKIDELEIALIVPKNHDIVSKAVYKREFKYPWIDINLLKNETIVCLNKDQSSRIYMDSIFEMNDIKPKISMQVHTTELTYLSVSNGFGVTIGYDFLSKYPEYSDKVSVFSFGSAPEKYDISVIRKKDTPIKKPVELFTSICCNNI